MAKSDKKKDSSPGKMVARSKDLRHRWEVLEELEAGLSLLGTEVKSLRQGRVSLKDSYCKFENHELFIVGLHISQSTRKRGG